MVHDRKPLSGTLALIAFVGFAWFTLAVLLMHLLRPDYAPARHFLSDYAVGRFGDVMTSAFVAFSLGCLALALALAGAGPRTVLGRLGVVPLFIAGAGLIVTAIYETDLPGAPYTRAGDIHSLSFIVNVNSLMLAALLLSIGFGGDSRWKSDRRPALLFFAVAIAGFAIQFLMLRKGAPYGLANRFFAAALMAWLLRTALRARVIARA